MNVSAVRTSRTPLLARIEGVTDRTPEDTELSASVPGVIRGRRGRRRWLLLMLVVAGLAVLIAFWPASNRRQSPESRVWTLPGEFEQTEAMLLGWDAGVTPDEERTLLEIAGALRGKVQIVCLVGDLATYRHAVRVVADAQLDDAIQFLEIPISSPWTRDFGPLSVRSARGDWRFVDMECTPDFVSLPDDLVPTAIGSHFKMPVANPPLKMEGGDLLSNGRGLILASTTLLERNRATYGYDESRVTGLLREYLGAEQVVYLQSLVGEPTGHIDMFATFPAPDTVVLGEFALGVDAANHEVLDQNSERLTAISVAGGKLSVVRIPMPAHPPGAWWSFTNVVYANGVLLVPTFSEETGPAKAEALAAFRRILPQWRIVEVDSRALMINKGGPHCATMNLFGISPSRTRSP